MREHTFAYSFVYESVRYAAGRAILPEVVGDDMVCLRFPISRCVHRSTESFVGIRFVKADAEQGRS